MKKFSVILICFVLLIDGNLAYAWQACYSTPSQIQDYTQSMYTIINQIPTRTIQEQQVGWNAVTRFGEQALDASNQLMQGTYVWARIMKKISMDMVWWDAFANMKMAFNSDAAIRDWNQLINLERYITDQALKVWYAWVLNIPVSESQVDGLKNNFDSIPIIEKTSWWEDRPTYWDLLEFVWKLNTFYKEIYLNAVWTNVKDRTLEEAAQALFSKTTLKVSSINNSDYNELKEAYEWATGYDNVCQDSYSEEFLENVESITESAAFRWWNALERFSDAWNLLKQTLNDVSPSWEVSQEYEDRKEDLLRRHYWTSLADDLMTYTWTWWVGMMRDSIKDNVIDPLHQLPTRIDEISTTTAIWEEKIDEEQRESIQRQHWQTIQRQAFQKDMENTFNSVLDMQQEQFADSTLQDPRWITQKIPTLSQKVYQWVNIIGSRQDSDTIIYNLGNACQHQCQNHWDPYDDCWYE